METSITSQRLIKMHYIYPLIIILAMVLKCSNGQQDTKRYHLSPHQYGLKPANPLDEVPIPDLKEPPPSLDDPRVGELNITALLLKLGTNYDPNVMSIEPPEKDNNVSFFGYRRSQLGRLIPTGTMPEYLNKMDFKSLTLANGSKLKTGISPKLKRKIQQFLWAYSACPVIYRWKDLGVRFWPRYLRSGFCPKNVSCSIPPGMTCKPSVVTHKTLLRWHCSTSTYYNPNKYPPPTNHRRHCKWMKVQYPLLTECSCSCETNSNDDD